MTARTFWKHALAALVLSVAGAVAYRALAPFAGDDVALRWLITGASGVYAAFLLRDCGVRVGRLVSIAAWLVLALALFVFDPRLWLWLAAHTGMLWLQRSLYAYDSLRAALIDAALSMFAIAAGVATALHTHSVFLALWSFFLVLALHTLIAPDAAAAASVVEDDRFEQAFRSAESALRRLATH